MHCRCAEVLVMLSGVIERGAKRSSCLQALHLVGADTAVSSLCSVVRAMHGLHWTFGLQRQLGRVWRSGLGPRLRARREQTKTIGSVPPMELRMPTASWMAFHDPH